MPTSDNLQDNAYTRVVEFLRNIDARRVQSDAPFRAFVGVKTTETRTQLQGGFQEPSSGRVGSPSVGGGGTGQLMYFIDGGILKTGKFVVSQVKEV